MSQEQPRRIQREEAEPIKYGDVFKVSGDLAAQPVAPADASLMQSAENVILGHTQRGGPAAAMQSAAAMNVRSGAVGPGDISAPARDAGVTVVEAELPGMWRVVTESVAGQVVGEFTAPAPVGAATVGEGGGGGGITIGEALEAAALTAGRKAVEQSDVAAIQARPDSFQNSPNKQVAEARATGLNENLPGGVAAAAQSAAEWNARTISQEYKTKLADILTDATVKLPTDKEVTGEDAERVTGAELRNKPEMMTYPGGVAASVTAVARLNQSNHL
ncbi:hypothetical protein QJS10_CPB19g01203 [Acorus calamus]|uniref:SMP domain-containing protein n=1 Tax=Acorus calamus TaxID=4465 RepID=A0AAV9CK02_ACOCL|nr:hypothetical protein QJS10_CPB19g01203 [Acorus calamus]